MDSILNQGCSPFVSVISHWRKSCENALQIVNCFTFEIPARLNFEFTFLLVAEAKPTNVKNQPRKLQVAKFNIDYRW